MEPESWELERRYSVPGTLDTRCLEPPASEDLHAWSIYRQNLNSDFTDSALGSTEKSPLPYGNFQLRDSTVQSILKHPRYGPKSLLADNSYTYLKFGLPRVLPPSRLRDGSSGYDSSDEGKKVFNGFQQASVLRSARSDPDFRHIHVCSREQQSQSQVVIKENARLRSVSEANLFHTLEANRRHNAAPSDPGYSYKPTNFETFHNPPTFLTSLQHPHIQLREVEGVEANKKIPVLRGISFEAGATDVLAIMSTTEKEGTFILKIISGQNKIKAGDIILNGRSVTRETLKSRITYISADNNLDPNLTTQQTLYFYKLLRGGRNITQLHADVIIEDLGLEATKHCLVSSLTTSEAKRLAIACRLLEDAHILVLDRPTYGLDIFDTFFLIEYLKQWAIRNHRLIILTLHPPTYEILTMVSKVTLISGGRIMFSGPRSDILPYFNAADFPCPTFKNPSDYYLDLVTLDDLSNEAMLESSQRIDHLAELAKLRLPPLSDPGPPGTLPPSILRAGLLKQMYGLLLKTLIFSQPVTLITLLQKIGISASLSIILGATFWDVASDNKLYMKDRIGFYYSSLGITFWPISLIAIYEINKTRSNVEKDINNGLYGRFAYIFIELICNTLSWSIVYLSYLAPAFAMSGLHLAPEDNFTSLWKYLGIGLLYLIMQHLICVLIVYLSKWTFLTIFIAGLIIGEITLAAGFTLHLENLPVWYRNLSPLRWTLSYLLPQVHDEETLQKSTNCKAKQIQHQEIIIAGCEPQDGNLALREIALEKYDSIALIWLGILVGIFFILIMISVFLFKYKSSKKTQSAPNKP